MSKQNENYTDLDEFRNLFARGLPILMYHKLGKPRGPLGFLYVSPRLLERQLRELKENGFRGAPLKEEELLSKEPGRIVLTFDDGYQNAFDLGMPLLSRYGFRAIQYIVSGRIGGQNDWDFAKGIRPERLMDEAQIRDWLAAGHQIGAHTLTHASLTSIPPDAAREEIAASKKALEDRFGIPVEHFCYPYGNMNQKVAGMVEEAGFRTGCSTRFGVNNPKVPRFELRRIIARYRSRSFRSVIGSVLRTAKLARPTFKA